METSRGKTPLRNEYINHSDIIKAMIIPTKGAKKINSTVLRIGSALMAPKPALATAAPANPPISVCDEDDGMPNHQVSRFQQMAAIRPEKTTFIMVTLLTTSGFTVLATVLA